VQFDFHCRFVTINLAINAQQRKQVAQMIIPEGFEFKIPNTDKRTEHDARVARTVGSSGPLVDMGKLLAGVGAEGYTYADGVAKGESVNVANVLEGVPLRPGIVISLQTIKEWGCPYCGSAHGSGVSYSRRVSASYLAKNQFFFNPQTNSLFTISKGCMPNSIRKRVVKFRQYQEQVRAAAQQQQLDTDHQPGVIKTVLSPTDVIASNRAVRASGFTRLLRHLLVRFRA
jgi:hypothetical protein